MLLPQELLFALGERADNVRQLFMKDGLSQQAARHLAQVAAELHLDPSEMVPMGVWGDGVPYNFDRSQSLEVFTLKLPGLVGEGGEMKMPLAVIDRKHLLERDAMDDIMNVLAWSFQQCAVGVLPATRHDGTRFFPSDAWRKRRAGQACPKGALVEFRADWVFYKQLMRFPQFNENIGCCWRCRVTPQTWRKSAPVLLGGLQGCHTGTC